MSNGTSSPQGKARTDQLWGQEVKDQCYNRPKEVTTRSSAVAERPHDASCH